MNRRRFVFAAALTPIFAGCVTPQEHGDISKFFQHRRLGIVTRPPVVMAAISQDWPLASRSGADSVFARRIQAVLPRSLDEFAPTARRQMVKIFLSHDLKASEIPYREDAGKFSPAYGPGEPYYLECRFFFRISLDGEYINFGATNSMTMLAPGGRTLDTAGVGWSMKKNARVSEDFGRSTVQFKEFESLLKSSDLIATELMKFAIPIGTESVESMLDSLRTVAA